MNWKEQFQSKFLRQMPIQTGMDCEKFIETEIIEKIIDNIPDLYGGALTDLLKQQLKDKWL